MSLKITNFRLQMHQPGTNKLSRKNLDLICKVKLELMLTQKQHTTPVLSV